MFEFATQALTWIDEDRQPVLARLVEVEGMSSRGAGDATIAVTGEPRIGQLLHGAADERVDQLVGDGIPGVYDVTIDDRQAAEAGLACGGRARVLVQSAAAIPFEAWAALAAREPVCLVSDLDGEEAGRTTWFTTANAAAHQRHDPEIVRWFGRGTSATAVMHLAEGPGRRGLQPDAAMTQTLVTALWPTPRLLIVGDGLLSAALERVARVLEWDTQALNEVGAAVDAVGRLRRGDALLVLSHQRDVDGPVLAAALRNATGYVGALGSRRTQRSRADWLRGLGVAEDAIRAMHGPAGLNIGARTPGEIAVSIIAEIVSIRAGAAGQSLRELSGPIHVDGLNTSRRATDFSNDKRDRGWQRM